MEWGKGKTEKLWRDRKEKVGKRKELSWRMRNTQEVVNNEQPWEITMVKEEMQTYFCGFFKVACICILVYLLTVTGRKKELSD